MPGTLYLDTARLGRMSPSARNANLDFVRLTAEEPSSLYFEKFLRDGKDVWPTAYRRRFPGLNCWQGVSELKHAIVDAVGVPRGHRVLLANRSAQLMSLAARLLFRLCRNVMTIDMSWPSYRVLLESEAARTSNIITTLPLRESVLKDAATPEQLTELIAEEYGTQGCDGLFLPAVDNLGVRLPIEQIVARIERESELRFVVMDGAQAFCHVPSGSALQVCDLFLAGCHKWLRAYNPMGIAIGGRTRSRELIDHALATMLNSLEIDDPLLRFTEQIETGRTDGYSETVNIAPLFSCSGAIHDALESEQALELSLRIAIQNAALISEASSDTGWQAVRPTKELQTGVLLLQADGFDADAATVDYLRQAFHSRGIVLTAYESGLTRLSMPNRPFDPLQVSQIQNTLRCINRNVRYRSPTTFVA